MPVPDARLQELIAAKDPELAVSWCNKYAYSEGWRITEDGALIIYDCDNPPAWVPPYEEE
jgi:hypothetical protein